MGVLAPSLHRESTDSLIHGTSHSKCFDKTITVVDFSFRSLFKGNGAGQGLRTSSILVIVPANT